MSSTLTATDSVCRITMFFSCTNSYIDNKTYLIHIHLEAFLLSQSVTCLVIVLDGKIICQHGLRCYVHLYSKSKVEKTA